MVKKDENSIEPVAFDSLDPYESILHNFMSILITSTNLLKIFPKITQEYITEEESKIKELAKTMTDEEREEFKQYNNKISEQIDKIQEWPATISGKFMFTNRTPAEIANIMQTYRTTSKNIIQFVHEMNLVYIIINFEEFLKNTIRLVFQQNYSIMRTNKELTHKEILGFQNMDELRNYIIDKELDDLISKDIEKLGTQLQEFFKLNIKQKKNWNNFIERFYRRHIIVHRNGITDERYRIKTKQKIVKPIITDEKYLVDSIDLFSDYSKTITEFFMRKFPIK